MENSGINKKIFSFFIVFAIYLLAFLAAYLIYAVSKYRMNILLITLIADIAATLIVWGGGLIFKNSSVYDPYWSVAPAVIISFWIIVKKTELSAAVILMLAVLIVWAVRLTLNWALRWRGLGHEDWRYSMLKDKSPRMWFLTNLVGINLVPTAIVFLVLIPVYYSIGFTGRVNYLIVIGFITSIAAVLIQTMSDAQMDLFRKSNAESSNNVGSKSDGRSNIGGGNNVWPNTARLNNSESKIFDSISTDRNISENLIEVNDISMINPKENNADRKISNRNNGHMDNGLWRLSRHPNYFGEVVFWWGLWIMQMGINPQKWITVSGPIVMVLLFVFISIPMMERHITESKPDYLLYKKQVSMLIPWFRAKKHTSETITKH